MRKIFFSTLLLLTFGLLKGQVQDDIQCVVKLIFENQKIIPPELIEKLQADSIIQVAKSSELLTKPHYFIVTDENHSIQISGIDYVFFHHFENWVRIYNIQYAANEIKMNIDIIINHLFIKKGTLNFKKSSNKWVVDKIKIRKGSMDKFWNQIELEY
ncbi:MAG: hypothetical protein ACOC2F_06885 [Bacteroidota bacterium]